MIDDSTIKNELKKYENLNNEQLFSQLAILSKDYYNFISSKKSDFKDEDISLFIDCYSEAMAEDTKEHSGSPFHTTGIMPEGFALNSKNENFKLTGIDLPGIHEWTVGPGKKLYKKFKIKFKDTICGKGGPYEQLEKGLLSQEDIPSAIVKVILTTSLTFTAFWLPIAVYVGLIIAKTTLKVYCED